MTPNQIKHMNTKTALISVFHKEGIVEFAKALVSRGWNILASGGTAQALRDAGVAVRDVGDIVGEPILGHRVVTLSREVHAGLLARQIPEDEEILARLGLSRIDLVCVDLYPLSDAIADPGATRSSVIEMTDVGGPTMLHSAAKGERIVICDPADRQTVIDWLDQGRPDEERFIDRLNAKADAIVADYCLTASRFRSQGYFDGLVGMLDTECMYGENAWQAPAGFYRTLEDNDPLALHNFRVLAGSAPSYNNFCDVDRMLQTVTHMVAAFEVNTGMSVRIAVAVKHGNCCGASFGELDSLQIVRRTVSGDTRAIFGGLVMTTFPVDLEVAEAIVNAHTSGTKRLLDGIVAPSFSPDAIEALVRKTGKCRLIENPALETLTAASLNGTTRFRQVRGGFLKQPNYMYVVNFGDSRVKHVGAVTPRQKSDLLLAWAVGSTSNSNTVTLVKDGQLIGNGVGQQDRVGCCELAIKRAKDAGHDTQGAVAYSDSFFPFPDGPEVLAKAGVKAILTSSGSMKDAAVEAVCSAYGVSLIMVPDALGRGFYNH
jgi:phosphoribosylaminoimidazolecarboxamide formyltransferase/IMP cyclohydrolase